MSEAAAPPKKQPSPQIAKTEPPALKPPDTLSGAMNGPIHVIFMRVYYEDTDALGMVYYANYLRFIERARTDMLRLIGIGRHDPDGSEREGLFVVRRCTIDYFAPARLDDVLEIRTLVTGLRAATLELEQAIYRAGKVLSTAQIRAACVDSAGRPRKISPKIRQKLQHLLTKIQPKADVNAR